jgi:hypothetical protein
MELNEVPDGWRLTVVAGVIETITIDFRLGLQIADGADRVWLQISSPCRLKGLDTDVLLDPEAPASLAPILLFARARVGHVSIHRSGSLTMTLNGMHTLGVDPDPSYEAWDLGTWDGWRLVALPGGGVARLDPPETNATIVRRRPR